MRPFILLLLLVVPPAKAQSPRELLYGAQDDWASVQGDNNLSSFVFRDRNRNGVYDMGDDPLSGIHTGLIRDGVAQTIALSNSNGYANFKTRIDLDEAAIRLPGTYVFEVVVPPDWECLSDNKSQTIEIVAEPEGSTGLRMTTSLRPIGLAPVLSVTGIWGGDAPARLVIIQREVETDAVSVQPGQPFRLQCGEGPAVLTAGEIRVNLTVGPNPVHLGKLDDRHRISPTDGLASFEEFAGYVLMKLPSGYKGLNWKDLNAILRNFTSGSQGYVNGITSGHFTAYTTNLMPGEISREEGFDLYSMELSLAWSKAEGQIAIIEAWQGDDLLMTDRIALSALGPVTYAPMIEGVTRLRITPEHGWQIVLDDLRFGLDKG